MQRGGGVPTTGAVEHAERRRGTYHWSSTACREGEGYLPLEQYSMQRGGGVPTTGAVEHAEGEGYLPLEQYSMQRGGGVPTVPLEQYSMQRGGGVPTTGAVEHAERGRGTYHWSSRACREGEGYLPLLGSWSCRRGTPSRH